MRIMREEIFGPVVPIVTVESEDEAIALANDSEFGLGASVWTLDRARGDRIARRIQAGMVWLNDHQVSAMAPQLPWGGVKDSGVGREGGWESFHEFTEIQSITVRVAEDDVDWYGSDAPVRLN